MADDRGRASTAASVRRRFPIQTGGDDRKPGLRMVRSYRCRLDYQSLSRGVISVVLCKTYAVRHGAFTSFSTC